MVNNVLLKMVKDFAELLIAATMFATMLFGMIIGILPALDAIGIYDSPDVAYPMWTIFWWCGVLCCYLCFAVLEYLESDNVAEEQEDMTKNKWHVFTVSMSVLTSWAGMIVIILIYISLSRKHEKQRQAAFENRIKGRGSV